MDKIYRAMASASCAATMARRAVERRASEAVEDIRSGEMDAQTMVEYAILAAFMAVALIAVVTFLSKAVGDQFTTAGQTLNKATTGTTPPATA